MTRLLLTATLTLLACLPAVQAFAQAARERQRLQDQIGVPPRPPPRSEAHQQDQRPPAQESPAQPTESQPSTQGRSIAPRARVFGGEVQRNLLQQCASCHRPGQSAARSGFALTGALDTDYRASRAFVVPGQPARSSLITKGLGVAHGAGAIFKQGSPTHQLLVSWVQAGAHPSSSADASPATETPASQIEAPASAASPLPITPGLPRESGERALPPAQAQAPAPESAGDTSPDEPAPLAFTPAFTPEVHELLLQRCGTCHAPAGPAAGEGGFVTDADPNAHYATVRAQIGAGRATESVLWLRATGTQHPQVLEPASAPAALLLSWIEAGAHGPRAAASTVPSGTDPGGHASAPGAPSQASPSSHDRATRSRAAPLVSADAALKELGRLSPALEGLTLHGRFDLSYERRDYTDNPFSGGGRDALRSYHHFLFLGRHTERDPLGLDVELTRLQFWELSARHRFGTITVGGKVGKLLVPFGADPLYHHSYGGLAGFDQRLLPIIWAQEGVSAFASTRLGPVGLAGDLYFVRGHRLRSQRAKLDLQSDLSPVDDTHPAVGARVRASLGPLGLWYSAYLNPLGFGRTLFLQALDLGLFRISDVTVLEDLSISLGAMRGDVSGAGAGEDHYHFGSYFQLRYEPVDFLYIQYRQGLRSFDNQRGLYLDRHALSARDGSTHSLGVVAQYRGLSLGIWHFWNLEEVDEIEDDFLRITAGYAF